MRPVALAKISQGFGHSGKNFDGMIDDLVGKTVNPLVQCGRDRFDRQLFETLNQANA